MERVEPDERRGVEIEAELVEVSLAFYETPLRGVEPSREQKASRQGTLQLAGATVCANESTPSDSSAKGTSTA
jgi:hypothetical protein